ncbi:pyrroline-5-carboxylate reductase [Streptococcus halotolerans]|uniref:pyrroline-5-carboxylate reductase n=1 Tax=Streptococcus halotolerans TaxID=1814128 RepID=UPI0007883764|nr:pyrroline-5-carboxylate reductase [Streptococcus halotolerans]
MKIGFIGVGQMASAIITGIKQMNHEIIISGSSPQRSKAIAKELNVQAASSHQSLVEQVDLVVLGIKPQLFEPVLNELDIKKPILSMAAGITLNRLAELTDSSLPLIRIMPNMNARILQSTTGISYNQLVNEDLKASIREIVDSFGTSYELAEKDFDTFTALAGSSPAYIYLFIEAMAKAGVKNGLSKAQSLEITTQTVIASAKNLVESEDSPHALIDKICSPGGTTIAGLMDLEKNGLTHTVVSAIDTTIGKAKNM